MEWVGKNILEKMEAQRILFLGGIILFSIMAILGWNKLQYGFNFIDEGMYMTDGWRMAAGDRLFPDNSTSVVTLYVVFNALIFKLFPDITLLSFRKIQYFFSLCSMLIFGLSIYRWSKGYWYIPYVLSVFAFTGLDPIGMSANMSYYTYPHLFIVLHISSLIVAFNCGRSGLRKMLFVSSGIFLWGVGFSFLPLVLTMLSPVFLWLVLRRVRAEAITFPIKELLLIMAPGAIFWFGFFAAYNTDFIDAALGMRRYVAEGGVIGIGINYLALQYLVVSAAFLIFFLISLQLPVFPLITTVTLLSGVMFAVVATNLFGLIPLYWRGWFAAQMWFAALLIVFMATFFLHAARKGWRAEAFGKEEQLLLIIMVPSTLYALVFSNYSSMGPLATLYTSIPSTIALALFLFNRLSLRAATRPVKAVVIVAFLFPFYYSLARADWTFTYFDLSPKYLTTRMADGFGAGIKTNVVFNALTIWMKKMAEEHSAEGDLAIIIDQTPMGYMLSRRRPALNHSWTGFANSLSLRRESIEVMKREKRFPKIAFRFTKPPLFFPVSLKEETFALAGNRKFSPKDPISNYIVTNMHLIDTFVVSGVRWVEFYVHKERKKN